MSEIRLDYLEGWESKCCPDWGMHISQFEFLQWKEMSWQSRAMGMKG